MSLLTPALDELHTLISHLEEQEHALAEKFRAAFDKLKAAAPEVEHSAAADAANIVGDAEAAAAPVVAEAEKDAGEVAEQAKTDAEQVTGAPATPTEAPASEALAADTSKGA
jgi:cell division septum initiation protein DivIVA